MPTVDIDKITVGSVYRNNVVTKIDEEVKDLKNGKVKIRRLISLDDGMVVIEDALYDFEEIVGEYKELQYNEVPFPDMSLGKKTKTKKKKKKDGLETAKPPASPILDDVDNIVEEAKAKATHKNEPVVTDSEEEQARIEAQEATCLEAEEQMRDLARRKATEQARLEEEERRLREAEEAEKERIRRLRDNWQPLKMPAFTSYNDDIGEHTRGTWDLPSLTAGRDYDPKNWPAKEVVLYPPNKMIPHSNSVKSGSPHGFWCYNNEALQPEEIDTEWIPRESVDGKAPFSLYLPGQKPPFRDGMIVGEWNMPSSKIWPPPKDPRVYKVHLPSNASYGAETNENIGIWKIGEGFPHTDEGAWNVCQVLVYNSRCPIENNGEEVPQGPWGIAASATPNKDGVYSPEDVWFILPDEEVPGDDEWACQGTWLVHEKCKNDWPPYNQMPTVTIVYHEDNVDELGRAKEISNRAIWVQNSNVDSRDWLPQQVITYKKGHEPDDLDPSKPHGLWGRDPDAKRDAEGNYSPMDVWYVFPGEESPNDDEWICEGVWTVESQEKWFPYQASPPEAQELQVCHPSQLNGNLDSGNAVWRIGEGFPDVDEDNWELASVQAYEFGEEPINAKEKPHGLWGRAVDAVPDKNGDFARSDTWLVYPGDIAPDDNEWNCCGIWILDDSKAENPQWPPYKERSQNLKSLSGPIVATIFPEKKARKENSTRGKQKGVWRYTAGKKVMDAGKQSKDVVLHFDGQGSEAKGTKHGGFWGYAPGAEPNSEGIHASCDLWCFAQGETLPPGDEWQYQGFWVPKDLPKSQIGQILASPSAHSIGSRALQCSSENPASKRTRVRRFAQSAWVYPSKEHAPPGHENNLQGIWSTPPGDQPGGKLGIKYKDGEPMEVMVHKRGKEPCQSDLKKMAHGKWGYAKDAQPNSRGIMDPKDIIFFPPGTDCGPDVAEEGVWSCPGAIIKVTTKWKFDEDSNIIHFKCTEIHFMNTVTTFTSEYIKKQ